MNTLKRYGFGALWITLAGVALLLYVEWDFDAGFMGIVETRTHKLGVQEAGSIESVKVVLGEEVRAGQVLLALDMRDLDAEDTWIKGEIARLEAQMEADRGRFKLEYAKLRLQSEAQAMELDRRRSELVAKRAELDGVRAEISRLEGMEKSGLGRSRDLTELQIRRDALISFMAMAGRNPPTPSGLRDGQSGGSEEDVVLSLLSSRREQLSELRQQEELLTLRRERRLLRTPVNGRVVKLNFMAGDTIEAFATLLAVEEPKADYIDVYIPETSDRQPVLGELVRIFPHRTGAPSTEGRVVFIDPGYSEIPQRLTFRNQLYWAHKFRVKLSETHALMPGEAARVELLRHVDAGEAQAAEAKAQAARRAAEKDTHSLPSPQALNVPAALLAKSHFEPSGLTWLADIGRFLVISDDTSRAKPEHAPWLYLMSPDGVVEEEPIVLEGVAGLNDLEAIAPAPDGTLTLVSSQSASRKGARKKDRTMILSVERRGRAFTVKAAFSLFDLLTKLGADERHALGLASGDDPNALLLNIEGAAWLKGDLLLALKEPVSERGALMWRLRDAQALFEGAKALQSGQLSIFAEVGLGPGAGFSDLSTGRNGELFALSTIPHASDAAQLGRVVKLVPKGQGLRADTLAAFPGQKPEGLSLREDGSLFVVFDAAAGTPRYTVLKGDAP